MKKVLIMEDEVNIRSFVVINLKRAGYEAIEAGTGLEALQRLDEHPDIGVAILDINVPEIDGFEVCRRIRATNKQIGIMMLTARTQEMDKVTGLMTGADDYVTKPFHMPELLARIRALTRRAGDYTPSVLTFGDLELDKNTFELRGPTGTLRLAGKEFQMLELLLSVPGRVIGTERLMERIWGYDCESEINVVWVCVSSLRKKLTALGSSVRIRASRGIGYLVEVDGR